MQSILLSNKACRAKGPDRWRIGKQEIPSCSDTSDVPRGVSQRKERTKRGCAPQGILLGLCNTLGQQEVAGVSHICAQFKGE